MGIYKDTYTRSKTSNIKDDYFLLVEIKISLLLKCPNRRPYDCCNKVSRPNNGIICLGFCWRDHGHNLVPCPPAKITIFMLTGEWLLLWIKTKLSKSLRYKNIITNWLFVQAVIYFIHKPFKYRVSFTIRCAVLSL